MLPISVKFDIFLHVTGIFQAKEEEILIIIMLAFDTLKTIYNSFKAVLKRKCHKFSPKALDRVRFCCCNEQISLNCKK